MKFHPEEIIAQVNEQFANKLGFHIDKPFFDADTKKHITYCRLQAHILGEMEKAGDVQLIPNAKLFASAFVRKIRTDQVNNKLGRKHAFRASLSLMCTKMKIFAAGDIAPEQKAKLKAAFEEHAKKAISR